jgi:peptidoglycan/LPS O-acetylase OafA/YrhL
MPVASFVFYLVLMPVFILEAWFFSRAIPFFHDLKPERSRVSSIDGLRGILALGVFFLHCVEYHGYLTTGTWAAPASNFYSQLGVASVTVFFFITGYVFGKKLIRGSASLAFRPFLRERLGRLGGAYAFACLLLFILVAFASSFRMNVSPTLWVAQHLLWLTFLGSGHEINQVPMSKVWLGPAWTLRCEWYFYLSLPFFSTFVRSKGRLLVILVASGIAATLLGQIHLHGLAAVLLEIARSYTMFLAYMFGVGMLLAFFAVSRSTFRGYDRAAGILASILVCATLFYLPAQYGILESAALALPFAVVASGNDVFGFLSSAPALFLGKLSYSFYLLHLLVLSAAGMLFHSFQVPLTSNPYYYWLFCTLCGTGALVLSMFSYRYLEAPWMRHGIRQDNLLQVRSGRDPLRPEFQPGPS